MEWISVLYGSYMISLQMMPVLVFDVAILDDCNDRFANASDVFFLWDRVVSFIQWSFLCGWGNILLKSV